MQDESTQGWSMRLLRKWLSSTPETRDDLLKLVQDSRQFLEPETVDMLEGVLGLPATQVKEIMTPRLAVVGLNVDDDLLRILPVLIQSAHSRFPVFSGTEREQVVGVLLAKDVLSFLHNPSNSFSLHQVIRKPVFVPETARSDQLMRMLKKSQSHFAVVVDEYGATAGIVTLEDLLEEIVGEIEDEHDLDSPLNRLIQADPREAETWHMQAVTPIDYFNEYFDEELVGEGVETLGGLVTKEMGHVTNPIGETVVIERWQFTILNADARSLLLLKAVRVASSVDEDVL